VVILLYCFGVTQAKAQNGNEGIIIGMVSVENVAVKDAVVTLYRLGINGDQIVNETITDSDGRYIFANLSKTTEYMIQASFKGIRQSKYLRINDSSEVNFDFSGKLEVQVRGVDVSDLAGLELKLYNVLGLMETNTTTDSNGLGIFESIDTQDTYNVLLDYKRIPYTVNADFLGKNLVRIHIDVLESTTRDEDFQVAFQHIIISGDDIDLSFRETVTVQNTGGKVFNTSWLMGWIPIGAFDITHNTMDCCIQFFESGDYTFDPMAPIFPNDSYQLSLNYKLTTVKPNQIIEKKLIYDTERIFFLIKKTEKLTAESLIGVTLIGVELYGENEYYLFEGINLMAGDLIQINLKTRVSIFERISDYRNVLDTFQLAIPLILVVFFFVYQNMKNDLKKLEEKESELIEELVVAEIEYLEGDITLEDLHQIDLEVKEASIDTLEKLQELEPEEYSESRLLSLEFASELRVAEKVIEILTEEYKAENIFEDSIQTIYSKYDEIRKSARV
jgi:hypothetical protein